MIPVKTIAPIPRTGDPGAFAAIRKHDIHCGIDLYCAPGASVHAIEHGVVVAVEQFTGESVGSPWWNDTQAVLVEGPTGVIVYGELRAQLDVGEVVGRGDLIGYVQQVLKVDKGVTPTSMLHLELHTHGTKSTSWWYDLDRPPLTLRDPTPLLPSPTE